ncbi:hypothetical protein ACSBR1_041629 [Camellia fascicularis]
MSFFKSLSPPILLLISLLFTYTNTTNIDIINSFPYTVWAVAVPGGGRQLDGAKHGPSAPPQAQRKPEYGPGLVASSMEQVEVGARLVTAMGS